jgi:death on curing protein
VAEPRWVDRLVVEAVHLDQIREHGGLAGLRDENALEASLARPRQRWHYEPETDVATLAAAYAFGLSRGHPFRDGNKRVGFVVMVVFLELNGWSFDAEESEAVTAMLALADGRLVETALAKWVKEHAKKPPGARRSR